MQELDTYRSKNGCDIGSKIPQNRSCFNTFQHLWCQPNIRKHPHLWLAQENYTSRATSFTKLPFSRATRSNNSAKKMNTKTLSTTRKTSWRLRSRKKGCAVPWFCLALYRGNSGGCQHVVIISMVRLYPLVPPAAPPSTSMIVNRGWASERTCSIRINLKNPGHKCIEVYNQLLWILGH